MLNDVILQLENELNTLKQLSYKKESLDINSLSTETKVKASMVKISLIVDALNKLSGNTKDNYRDLLNEVPEIPTVTIRGVDYTYLENGSELEWYIMSEGVFVKIDYDPIRY